MTFVFSFFIHCYFYSFYFLFAHSVLFCSFLSPSSSSLSGSLCCKSTSIFIPPHYNSFFFSLFYFQPFFSFLNFLHANLHLKHICSLISFCKSTYIFLSGICALSSTAGFDEVAEKEALNVFFSRKKKELS